MKRKCHVKTYFAIGLCFLLQIAHSQTSDYKWSVGPVGGFKMIKSLMVYDAGIQLSQTLSTNQRVHLEASFRFAGSNLAQNWGSIPMNMKTDIGSVVLGASYDWFPFVNNHQNGNFFNSLKVIGGAWYVTKPVYNFDASLQDPLVWGAITFTTEEIGNVATTIKTHKVQPFLGLGYDDFYSGKVVNFSINGGVLYQGKPEVTMVATNMLKPTEESAARFEHNLSSYQFSPFVQLLVQFNLK